MPKQLMRLVQLLSLVLVSPLLSCSVIGCGSSRASTVSAPLPSPNGKLILVTSINGSHANPVTYGCVRFAIKTKTGRIIYQQQTHAAARMRWSMAWRGNDAVVLHSSDYWGYDVAEE